MHPHSAYLALADDPATRQRLYRDMVMAAVDPNDVDVIRRYLQRQHVYGGDRFRQAIEAQLGRSVGPQKIGRPRKAKVDQRQSSQQTQLSLGKPLESRL